LRTITKTKLRNSKEGTTKGIEAEKKKKIKIELAYQKQTFDCRLVQEKYNYTAVGSGKEIVPPLINQCFPTRNFRTI